MNSTSCRIKDIREVVGERLGLGTAEERRRAIRLGICVTPATFWEHAEEAGRLIEALSLFDDIATSRAHWSQVSRETKAEFARRIEREGRQSEVEEARSKFGAT